jgi:hypothetical protein
MPAKKCGFIFGHRWPKKGRKMANGSIQKKCSRCGRLRNTKAPKCTFLNPHKYKLDRRMKGQTLRCRKCGHTKKGAARK